MFYISPYSVVLHSAHTASETSQDGTDRWCTDCEIRPKGGDNERRRRARLEMFYKLHYALVSINSSYLPKPPGSRLSSRKNNTCSYDIPSCRTQYRQTTFFRRTIPDRNGLPQEAVNAESLDCFKSRLSSLL